MSTTKKATEFGTRGNLYYMDPEDLVVACDKGHPLYDERKDYPVNERQVVYMMAAGCALPVVARREGEKAHVIDGRQRVQAAREANRRLKEQGTAEDDLIRLPVTFKRADDDSAVETMIAANSFARTDPPLVSARKIQAYINRGKTEEQAAAVFNVHLSTIRSKLSILETIPEVQSALEKGAIGVTDAIEISKVAREAQPEALAKALESCGTAKRDEDGTIQVDEEKIPTAKRLRKKNKRPGKATIMKLVEDAPVSVEVQAALKWVLGLINSETASKEIKGFRTPTKKSKKTKEEKKS